MASTKFEVSMEIFKFQGEPDVSVTLTGKSPAELDTALKTLETIAKTTTLYNGDSAPEAEKSVTSEPKQAAPVVSTADKKAPPKKPVSWLTPVGAKGLMLLRCPKCKSEFVQFLRDRSAQLFMWCIVVSMHQDDGIGASRLLRACNEMDAFEKKYQTATLYGSSKNATDAMRENLKGICDFEVRLPVDRAPRGRREEQLRMASNQGAEIAWLVMAATCHETFGYGRDRLARLKQNSMNNYKQYLEWEKEDKDLALDRLRRCVQDALKEDLRVTDTDDRKGMLSTPGRGPSVYETAAVYSEIFRRARAGRAVAPLAVYSAAKYDETMTAARKQASVMLGL